MSSAARRIVPLTLDNLDELPAPCRSCVFWEVGPVVDSQELPKDEAVLAKEAWVSATLLDWGSCGKVVYVAGVAAGYAMFAPPGFVPRAVSFPTSPVSGDAVLLMNVMVLPEWRNSGVGRMLAQAVAAELVPRGVKAIEAFGSTGAASTGCLLPTDYLLSVGFKTVRPHPLYPRLRMELKSTVSWRYDVEYALERIFGSNVGRSLTPVG
ncbi:GNAT family N-acetyltransferase [Jatrophihabitans telluris]|uniref:GNAT family N-acetyltransferase n=1 Tax=Jatrophihabitans telluris TaxID=2038343 RepID=A0ABY4R064_9ACTN|nr:GNAT family N-acetyltransferase [Jatrophihabitans telluris]UQX88545.1 GNAT family N-acetyltransferase [Jatrophihabitans telluris]